MIDLLWIGKDYGGREHNYNQQFYYNQKAQQEQKSPKSLKPQNNTLPDQVHHTGSNLLFDPHGQRDPTPNSLPQISGNRMTSGSRNSMRGESKGNFLYWERLGVKIFCVGSFRNKQNY